jgi:ribosomal-protein-alanine N-acetyltransferase
MIKDAFSIETQNLILRALTPELYQYVFTHLNDEELKTFFGHETEEAFNKEKLMFEQGLTAYNKSFFIFQLIEKSSLKNIGWCGFHNIATRHNRAEIGYVINNKNNWGKGFMKEALHEILCYGFDELNLHRIEAITGRENFVSQKLLKDRGFIYEGLLREHYFTNNIYEDSLMFSLMEKELIRN